MTQITGVKQFLCIHKGKRKSLSFKSGIIIVCVDQISAVVVQLNFYICRYCFIDFLDKYMHSLVVWNADAEMG